MIFKFHKLFYVTKNKIISIINRKIIIKKKIFKGIHNILGSRLIGLQLKICHNLFIIQKI